MSEPGMPGFVAGLAARHDAAAVALRQAFAGKPVGFAPVDLIARIDAARAGPRHFSPADRGAKPTEGWNPTDPEPTPFHDPIAAARAAAYEEGLAAGIAIAGEDAARDRAMIAALAEQLGAAGRIDREGLARRLRATVMLLVSRLVGEAGVSADLLAARIEAATGLLADAAESAILRVHPDDVAPLAGLLPDSVFPVGDASVTRGAFVLEAASTIVEDGPDLWLEQLAHAIDHVPVPAAA